MKSKNILITLITLAIVVNGCMKDDFEDFVSNEHTTNTSSVITLTTDRYDGIINLSIVAPQHRYAELWIDLNGDSIRAQDGSEKINVFNRHQDYRFAPGMNTVSIYGGITYLGCASNELRAIDISGNPYLTTLNAPLNRLTDLDVSKNSELTHLDCSGNKIVTLNVSGNSALVSLWSFNNQLSELKLSNNANLVFLDCSGNQLNVLDISRNRELVRLICYNNQLNSIDISQNEKLNRLWLFGNQFSDREIERIRGLMKGVGSELL